MTQELHPQLVLEQRRQPALPTWEPILPHATATTDERAVGDLTGRRGTRPFSMAIVGGTGLGKTHWFRCFWKKHLAGRFDLVILVCSTSTEESLEESDYGFLCGGAGGGARLRLFGDWDPAIVDWVVRVQEARRKRGRRKLSVALVADDIKGNRFRHCPVANDLWRMGRHHGISPIRITHKLTRLSTECRNGVQILVAFRCMGPGYKAYRTEVLDGTDESDFPEFTGAANQKALHRMVTDSVWGKAFVCLVRDMTEVGGRYVDHTFCKSTATDFD